MWGSALNRSKKLMTQIDGVDVSAPESISRQQLKDLTYGHVRFAGNPKPLSVFLEKTLESMGYATRPARMVANESTFGQNVLDVELEIAGIKANRVQAGVHDYKKNSYLWLSAIGVVFLLGSNAVWLTAASAFIVALGVLLWFLAPVIRKYKYHPASIALWIQGNGTAYKGTKSKKLAQKGTDGTGAEDVVNTTYLDSELDLFIGIHTQVQDEMLDEKTRGGKEKADVNIMELSSAILDGRKQITIGHKEKYDQLLANQKELDEEAQADLVELRNRLAKFSQTQ